MQAETQAKIDVISSTLELLRKHVNFDEAVNRLEDLEAQTTMPDFWNDQAVAQNVMREKNRLERQINLIRDMQAEMDDCVGLIELGLAEGDDDVVAEAELALSKLVDEADKRQLESLLSGEADANDCFLEIHAGAGGTEAQDWAQMLVRMYGRWCEQRGYKVQMIEESAGEEAGIKSVTMRIDGENAYGWLKTE
jgi:peptide chain release factor 2